MLATTNKNGYSATLSADHNVACGIVVYSLVCGGPGFYHEFRLSDFQPIARMYNSLSGVIEVGGDVRRLAADFAKAAAILGYDVKSF